MSDRTYIRAPAYCLEHRRLHWLPELCPECQLDADYPAPDYTWARDLLDAELFDAFMELQRAERRAWAYFRSKDPDVDRGRRVREGGRIGPLRRPPNTKKGPPDEILVREVKELHERNPRLSWSTVCERVGRRHGLSRRTVETRARAADWRQRSG